MYDERGMSNVSSGGEGEGRGGGDKIFLSIDQQLHVESMVGRPGTTIFKNFSVIKRQSI